jgi:N-succinyldiaminopimelate aminotransferase
MYNDRLNDLFDYPFTRLRTLLDAVPAPAGITPVALSLGEPRHAPPALIDQVLASQSWTWNLYPPVPGTPAFRAACARWLTRRYGLPADYIDAERMVLPLAGSREALFMVALLAVPPRKNGVVPVVLMPNPYYAPYEGGARFAGAEPVTLPATAETGFLPDLDAIPVATLERTALFYLCTPGNPQGAVASIAYLQKAIALARRYDFVLLLDECYAEIYTQTPPPGGLEACLALDGGALDHVLVVHSLSKRSSAPGLRSGFIAGDPSLITLFSRLRSYAAAGTPLPILAVAEALWNDETHVVENRAAYRRKFELADDILGGRFGYYRPGGGFFLWLDVGDGEAATRQLWTEAAIRVLPGAYLSRPEPDGSVPGARYIRVALVDAPETLQPALTRMAEVLSSCD